MKDSTIKGMCAMVCITALEVINLLILKNDGIILSGVIGAIAGLGGFLIGKGSDK